VYDPQLSWQKLYVSLQFLMIFFNYHQLYKTEVSSPFRLVCRNKTIFHNNESLLKRKPLKRKQKNAYQLLSSRLFLFLSEFKRLLNIIRNGE